MTFDNPPGDGKNRASGCQEDKKVGKAAGSARKINQTPFCEVSKNVFCLGR